MRKTKFKIIENGLNETELNTFSEESLNTEQINKIRGGIVPKKVAKCKDIHRI